METGKTMSIRVAMSRAKRQGITLVELLIVIAILLLVWWFVADRFRPSENVDVWTIDGTQIDSEMNPEQVGAALGAPLKNADQISSQPWVEYEFRGDKFRAFEYLGAGHVFHFTQKVTRYSDEPTHPIRLVRINVGDINGKELRPSPVHRISKGRKDKVGGDPNKLANELFVETVQLIKSAENKTGDAAIADYDQALAIGQRIIDDYSDSDLAVKLMRGRWPREAGDTLFSGHTLVEIRAKVTTLKDEAESQKRILLTIKGVDPGEFGGTATIYSVGFSPDRKRIVSSSGHTPRIWDAQTGREQLRLKSKHVLPVTSVNFSPDGKRIVSGSLDTPLTSSREPGKVGFPNVAVYSAQTGQNILALSGHSEGGVWSVAFSPDGQRIVSGGEDNTVRVWDAQTGQATLTLKGHSGHVLSVSFSPDGKRIVSGSRDKTLKIWDAATGEERLTLKGHVNRVWTAVFSPNGKQVVSGGNDKTLKVWDAQTGQVMLTLKGHSDFVFSVSFSPDGKWIISGSNDQTLKVWDAQTGQVMLTLKGHTDSILSVSFSDDGAWIVSGGFDKTVKVWDAKTGRELPARTGTTTSLSRIVGPTTVSFSCDGNRSRSGDNTLKAWDISTLAKSK